jgi:hypothetical protein
VPYLINGNSGKAPAGEAGRGGFTGWTMLGVDPGSSGDDWLAAEIRPHVDGLALTVPSTVRIGSPTVVSAALAQGSRQVPVAYPVSADWSGSPKLHIGPESGVRPWHVAWLDPVTGAFTALRPGQVTVAVTVNGVTQHTDVTTALPTPTQAVA